MRLYLRIDLPCHFGITLTFMTTRHYVRSASHKRRGIDKWQLICVCGPVYGDHHSLADLVTYKSNNESESVLVVSNDGSEHETWDRPLIHVVPRRSKKRSRLDSCVLVCHSLLSHHSRMPLPDQNWWRRFIIINRQVDFCLWITIRAVQPTINAFSNIHPTDPLCADIKQRTKGRMSRSSAHWEEIIRDEWITGVNHYHTHILTLMLEVHQWRR